MVTAFVTIHLSQFTDHVRGRQWLWSLAQEMVCPLRVLHLLLDLSWWWKTQGRSKWMRFSSVLYVWQIRKIKLWNTSPVLCRILSVVSIWQAVRVVKWSLLTASSVPGPTPLNWLQWDHKGMMTKKLWSASARTRCVSQSKTLLHTCSVGSVTLNS